MDLSSNDVRNYEFPSQLRGYDKDEVDQFKERVAELIDQLKQENLKHSTELDSVKSQLEGLREFEDAIKSAAIDARKNADKTMSSAKEEADKILDQAKTEAEQTIMSYKQQMVDMEQQLSELKLTRNSYINKFRELLHNHTELVLQIETEEVSRPSHGEDIEEMISEEVDESQRETLTSEPVDKEIIKTEEAQAAEEIVVAEDTPDETESTEEEKEQHMLAKALNDEAPAAPQSIDDVVEAATEHNETDLDPELATALSNYQKNVSAEEPADAQIAAPKPGEFVETTARAEDVPEGFISPDRPSGESTDKLNLTSNSDEPLSEESAEKPQVDLASALDGVAAKFEEEMDKAEQNH